MAKTTAGPPKLSQKIHLRYTRLPDQVLDVWDELVFRSGKVVVGRSRVSTENSIVFDGETVLDRGFEIVYFDLVGEWFTVGKIRNMRAKHTGYYCDIATPPRFTTDGVELTDLFLDLWVSPDLRYRVLDQDEFEEARRKGWITVSLHDKAERELGKLIRRVERGNFPPPIVKALERKLQL